ncbi:hypothetical protein FRC17_001598 [Serendipita sp. 399]|nr:hypothetical protein FRC17_001598 [Serendipita sp. 399]
MAVPALRATSARRTSMSKPPHGPISAGDDLSAYLDPTVEVERSRGDRPRSILGKRRSPTRDADEDGVIKPTKRSRIEEDDAGEDCTQVNWWPIGNGTINPSYLTRDLPSTGLVDDHTLGAVSRQTKNKSILPFSWKEGECDPMAETTSQSTNVALYNAAWTALRAYKRYVDLDVAETKISEARQRMHLAWKEWGQAKEEPPTLLWLSHTGRGVDSKGREAIAQALGMDERDDLGTIVQRWIDDVPKPIAPPNRATSRGVAGDAEPDRTEGAVRMGLEDGYALPVPVSLMTPQHTNRGKKLPSWAQSSPGFDSVEYLNQHLTAEKSTLTKKQKAALLAKMFDKHGKELVQIDEEGDEVSIAEGTRAYHLLPDEQKAVILEDPTKRPLGISVVCCLNFSIVEGKTFKYTESACGRRLSTMDIALRHVKGHHFGLRRPQSKGQ